MTNKAGHVRNLVVAPKAALRDQLPHDWQEQIARISGVELIGSGFNRAQLQVTDQALDELKAKFGHVLDIEDVLGRKPANQ
jgi:hypothetical protein